MASPLEGKRLLLVAEDADLAALVAGAAARLGVKAFQVRTGREALDAIARRPPDAVLLDLPLADVRGSEVLAALGAARIPAVAVSGVYRGPKAAAEVRRLGAADFFEKPFDVEALAAAVARALGAPARFSAEEAKDEVTGARPLRAEEIPESSDGISAALFPALDDGPIRGRPAPRDGLAMPIPEPPRARPSAAESPPPPRGDLSQTTVPRLLVAAHVAQATGALTVSRGPVKKIVVVEGGAPVYAASNVGAERFGAICVRRGILPAERLEALRAGAPPAARTADLLQAAGLLSPERRLELVGGQIRAIAWSTFEWRDGAYEFQLGRPPASRVQVRIPMGDLVLEGMLRASTLPRLRADLPDGIHLAPAPDPAFELYALGLRPKEAHLLSLADGTKSVADLVRLSELPEREALAFLQACRVMKVLDEVDRVLASSRRMGFM